MKITYIFVVLGLFSACSNPGDDLAEKKSDLETAKSEMIELKAKIASLEKEIQAVDPNFAQNRNSVLVSTLSLEKKSFEHFVEIRGAVQSRRNVVLSAQMGGIIREVYAKEGQRVSKGQTLVVLDADVLRNSIGEIKTQLDLAKITYDKQSRLWEQKIGTEIQYLQAKNQVESLEKRLGTTYAQLEQMTLKAPFTGTIDRVDALVGEMAAPGLPLVRMVNSEDIYVNADVSEDFIGKFSIGDPVEVLFPTTDKRIKSTITAVGQVINPENRTFVVEVKLPSGIGVKPNQVTVVKFRDYVNDDVFTLPTKIILSDNAGQYVFAIGKRDSVDVAKKVYVKAGLGYNSQTEVLQGLTGSETIIFQGFRDVTEGAEVTIAAPKDTKEVAAK
jgi:RND family efflux transporter MFP subunit